MKEQEYSKECTIIAYYLSKYDELAISALGYKTQSEAFQSLAALFGKKTTFIKLRRDEFDAIVSSVRRGWWQRLPAKGNWQVHCELKMMSFEQLTELVKSIIQAKLDQDNELKTKEKPSLNVTKKERKRIVIKSDQYHEVKVRKNKN